MPTLSDYTAIRARIVELLGDAWGVTYPDSIDFGAQPLPKRTENLPYAVCMLQPVDMAFSGPTGTVRSLNQDVVFKIYAAFRKPEPQVLDAEAHKIDRFNAAALLFEGAELFANVGMLPHVSNFDPTEWFDPMEGAHGFCFDVSMLVNRTWGT